YSNEPREVILEFMRLMKEEGIIITGDDIAQVSPVKERKDFSDSEDDQPAGTVIAAAPKKKRNGKEKVEDVVEKKKKRV
ncbi:hypothetical protein A2U01_0096324, partial [Trifolium medium]|nr:hypothetical protein [Trifolium medium]